MKTDRGLIEARDRLQGVLDDLVHEAYAQQASGLNNRGMRTQLGYLLGFGYDRDEIARTAGLTRDEMERLLEGVNDG